MGGTGDRAPVREMARIYRSFLDRFYWAAFVLSFGFLCFFTGFLVTISRAFPFYQLRGCMAGIVALLDTISAKGPYQTNRYTQYVPAKGRGVTRYDPTRAFNGYTIFTSGGGQSAYLIDMRGQIVHQWHMAYDKVWNSSSTVKRPLPESAIYWRNAHLYPNGDLLAVYEANDEPYGYGLVKLDAESRLIWTYLDHVHHRVSVGADGRIYALTQRIRTDPVPGLPSIEAPSLEDFVVALSPEGKLLRKVSLYDAFARSRYRGAVKILQYASNGDTLHLNSVKPLPPAFRKTFPFVNDDTVLVSSRNLDAIMLLDLDKVKVTWLERGPWARQHDPELLPNGHILLFDNLGDLARGGRSRVLEIDPDPLKIIWEFPGNSHEDLYSEVRSSAQRLPNENVLITESDNARLLEVTPDKKVVWEYHSPFVESDGDQKYVGVLESARRFAPDQLAFTFNRSDTRVAQAENKVGGTNAK